MNMPLLFDTLQFAKELENAGLDAKVAEAQAKAQFRMLTNLLDQQIATRDDIKEFSNKLEIKLDQNEKYLDQFEVRFDRVELRLDQMEKRLDRLEIRLDRVETRLDQVEKRLDQLEIKVDKLEVKIDKLAIKIDSLEHIITMKMGRWMIASVGFIATLLTVFHFT
jgi:chromosome segregation ATPase